VDVERVALDLQGVGLAQLLEEVENRWENRWENGGKT